MVKTDPESEQLENNINMLETLLKETEKNGGIIPPDLENEINEAINFTSVTEVNTTRILNILESIKINGAKPENAIEIFDPSKKEAVEKGKIELKTWKEPIDLRLSKTHTFSSDQLESLREIVTVLAQDVRNQDGYFDVVIGKDGKPTILSSSQKKMNKAVNNFYNAFQVQLEAQKSDTFPALKNLNSRNVAERAEYVNGLVDLVTKKGLSKKESIGVILKEYVNNNPDEFDTRFKEAFAKLSKIESALELPEIFDSIVVPLEIPAGDLDKIKQSRKNRSFLP